MSAASFSASVFGFSLVLLLSKDVREESSVVVSTLTSSWEVLVVAFLLMSY